MRSNEEIVKWIDEHIRLYEMLKYKKIPVTQAHYREMIDQLKELKRFIEDPTRNMFASKAMDREMERDKRAAEKSS